MSEKKKQWFVYCATCGEQISITDAVKTGEQPFPPSQSWKGPCPHCGAVHTYRPQEMHLGEEY
jgi:predicted RNA-binding Zn-ribbon protein involved in translation (DUF1610 family)